MATEKLYDERSYDDYLKIIEKYGHWVDPKFLNRRPVLEAEVERFFKAHLDDELRELALRWIQTIEDETPETFGRGDAEIWAAGLVYALFSINGRFKKGAGSPTAAKTIAEFYGVKTPSMQQRAGFIREATDVDEYDVRLLTAANRERVETENRKLSEQLQSSDETLVSVVGRRPQKNTEFVDRERVARDLFYDAVTENNPKTIQEVEALLRPLIVRDPDFFDPYLQLARFLEVSDQPQAAQELRDEAYARALHLICDRQSEWPALLEWGWLENRHILQTLFEQGFQWWSEGRTDAALALFRRILRVCPEDNQGIRYYLLAIRQNMTFSQFDKRFTKGGFWDMTIVNWFNKESKNFPDEFGEWK